MYSVPERMLPRKQTINAGLTLILLVLTFLSFPYLFGQRRPTLASVTSFERNATTSGHTTAGGKASQLLKQNSKSPGSAHASSTPAASGKIDWTRFAYVLHATSLQYLCNSVMIIERLQAVGAKADRVLLYPNDIVLNETDPQGALLIKSRDKYGAILKPVEILRKQSDERKLPPHPLSQSSPNIWATLTRIPVQQPGQPATLNSLPSIKPNTNESSTLIPTPQSYNQWTSYSSCPLPPSHSLAPTGSLKALS